MAKGGKRIRSVMITGLEALDHDEVHSWQELCSYTFQDDVLVVGFELYCTITLWIDAPTYTAGELWNTCVLARGGITDQQSWLCTVTADGLICEPGTSFQYVGKRSDHEVVMFPNGLGIEIDEGESLYIHNTASTNGIGDSGANLLCVAYVYYIER